MAPPLRSPLLPLVVPHFRCSCAPLWRRSLLRSPPLLAFVLPWFWPQQVGERERRDSEWRRQREALFTVFALSKLYSALYPSSSSSSLSSLPFLFLQKIQLRQRTKEALARSVFLFQQSLSRTKCWTFWRSAPGVPGVQGSGASTFNSAAKEDSDLFQDAELGVPLRRRRPCRPLRRRP